MSKDNAQTNQPDMVDDEFDNIKRKTWDYPDPNINLNQNRTCCSPVDEIEAMENDEENSNITHNVEVQTDKSTLYLLKQDRKIDNKRYHFSDNSNLKCDKINEFENVKLRKTGLRPEHEKVTAKLAANINSQQVYDEYAETDLDQPMDYARCYDETNCDEEKKDFSCIEEEKVEAAKRKGAYSKELPRNKKEMFSNTSRSFKEIFNFFKDRDKKRSVVDNTKISTLEGSKTLKTPEIFIQKVEKSPQQPQQSVESEKEVKSKTELQCPQQTPLMFSRCSSLGSLNGFEQNSINDDHNSTSDFSRRTSGVISPSELPDSPAQTVSSGSRSQQKSQIGCFGKKKIQSQTEKLKTPLSATPLNEISLQSENCLKKLPVAKRSVFEDNITSFKDESTPTKLHSMAASSLSSLTIDDDDDYDLMNKIILNKEKQNLTEETKVPNNRQEPIGESNLINSSIKIENTDIIINEIEENVNDEEDDKLTDLTPYEEQLLDECIRRGIAKWTKQNINEIKPFSWDVGFTCLATRAIITSRIRLNSSTDIQNDIFEKRKDQRNKKITNNNLKFEQNALNKTEESRNCEKYSNEETGRAEPVSNLEESYGRYEHSNFYLTYEEHLLDQCIRRGMAKITKRNINDIKPFSWDANKICLTTRAMMLRSHNEDIYSTH